MAPPDRDLVRAFKAARWDDTAALDAFVREVAPVTSTELRGALAVLVDRSLAADGNAQRRRCAAFLALVDASPDPSLFVPVVRALRSADAVARATLVQSLPKVNQVESHDELCETLASPDPDVRKAGALGLRLVGGRSAFVRVSEMVRDPSFQGRAEAMETFTAKARHGAIPMLADVLTHGTLQERARAVAYLGDRELMAKALDDAAEAVSVALDDRDERIAGRAIDALASLVPEEAFYDRVGYRVDSISPILAKSVVEALRRYATPRSIERLGRRFRAGPNAIRMDVLDSLEHIGNDDVLPVIAEALGFSQMTVRERAGRVLANLTRSGKVDTARTVLWLLRSRDVNVRRIAVEVARQSAERASALWPKLLGMLRDEDWWVRERVMDALVEIAGEQLTRYLVGMLEDPSDVVRRFAIGALCKVHDPKALGALVRCAQNDADWWVRELAVQAAAELGDPRAVPYILDIMGRVPEMRCACIDALRTLKAREGAPHVAALLIDNDPDVRLAAVRALGDFDHRAELDRLRALEQDPVARVRTAARELLEKWNATRGLTVMTDGTLSYLDRLLVGMAQNGADDLVVAAGRTPYVKRMGRMLAMGNAALSEQHVQGMLLPLLSPDQRAALDALDDVDLSYEVKSTGQRFRAHVFRQMSGLSSVFRLINNAVPELEKLGLPPVVCNLANAKNGLVLVGGPTGSGKSTTLAAIIDHINRTSTSRHIVTLEDPIEVVHRRKGCLVSQREVGTHTHSFNAALRSVLRQDPDVILVGEMRDLAMVSFAVTAAETGHLVLGTVHTSSAETTVDRLVNVFPSGQQPQVRSMLAESLRAVVCQHLIPRKEPPGRVIACEVMINNDAVSNLIRKGKSFQIPAVVATSRDAGMQSMDSELMRLYRDGTIAPEEAYLRAVDKKTFEVAFGWTAEVSAKPSSNASNGNGRALNGEHPSA
ncbi:MAG: PilT/PilU family type 4a pilus ATPase [Polyangiales bacterium]